MALPFNLTNRMCCPEMPNSWLLYSHRAAVELELVGWNGLASNGLVRAYGDEEPDYTSADILP
jgi:hypothetical protein